MLLWGVNRQATSPAQARRIIRARNRGAKLIVIDPRKTALAEKADLWLRVKPGTDGQLAMALIHVLIEENLFDAEFARRWTNAPFLVRGDNRQLLTHGNLVREGNPTTHVIWDETNNRPMAADFADGRPALSGAFDVQLGDRQVIRCSPVFELLKTATARFAPEHSEVITTVPAGELRKAARLFAAERPSCYCMWVGLEQDHDAVQTNRAASSTRSRANWMSAAATSSLARRAQT